MLNNTAGRVLIFPLPFLYFVKVSFSLLSHATVSSIISLSTQTDCCCQYLITSFSLAVGRLPKSFFFYLAFLFVCLKFFLVFFWLVNWIFDILLK